MVRCEVAKIERPDLVAIGEINDKIDLSVLQMA